MRDSDLILHAGDFTYPEVLDELETLGPPVVGVHGNVDVPELRARLPEARVVKAEEAKIGMVHDAGPAYARLARLRARFPKVDAVVFGHSHIPLHERGEGFQIFNPGSPTDKRREKHFTMGVARVDGRRIEFEIRRLQTI